MQCIRKTRFALLGTSLLNEPLTLLYSWLPFIMRKELGATAFQIALLLTLRPVMSIISFYWSAHIEKKRKNLRLNLVIAGILARSPFLAFLFTENSWFLVFASALHMLFLRGGIPAWMEILKLNLPKEKRDKLFSLSSSLGYAEGILLALGIGTLLDENYLIWKILYAFSALLGIIGVYIQWRMPIRGEQEEEEPLPHKQRSSLFLRPWKNSWQLLRTRTDYAHFQWGFMIGGFGIMLTAAALPLFFVDVLKLSHTNFATARSICMGFGFILSSGLWARALQRLPIAHLACIICVGFGIFPLLLMSSIYHLTWLYLAYVLYGVTQGGSHMLWHLSGPLFAKNEDSSQFSDVSVVTVGIRGLVAPFISNLLCVSLGPRSALLTGMVICLSGSVYYLLTRNLINDLNTYTPTKASAYGDSDRP